MFAGAIGSGAIALLFVAIDALRGNPLFTPSLLGSVLLTGASPAEVVSVRLDMVAIYSLIHLLAMSGMGVLFSLLYFRTSLFNNRPWLMG